MGVFDFLAGLFGGGGGDGSGGDRSDDGSAARQADATADGGGSAGGRGADRNSAADRGDETDGDSLFLTAHAVDAGVYFAAVVERHLGAEWREGSDGEVAFVVDGGDAEARIDPVGLAGQALRGEDPLAATYEAVRGQLSIDASPVEE